MGLKEREKNTHKLKWHLHVVLQRNHDWLQPSFLYTDSRHAPVFSALTLKLASYFLPAVLLDKNLCVFLYNTFTNFCIYQPFFLKIHSFIYHLIFTLFHCHYFTRIFESFDLSALSLGLFCRLLANFLVLPLFRRALSLSYLPIPSVLTYNFRDSSHHHNFYRGWKV